MALLLGSARQLAARLAPLRTLARAFSAQPEPEQEEGSGEVVTVKVNDYKLHKLEEGPPVEVVTSKSELKVAFRQMYLMRRREPVFYLVP